MEPNWNAILKNAAKLKEVLAYPFLLEAYPHSMLDAAGFAGQLLGSDPRKRYSDYIARLEPIFQCLHQAGVSGYAHLMEHCGSQEDLQTLASRADLAPDDIGTVLGFLASWVFPNKIYLRELLDKDDTATKLFVTHLRECGIRFNLDVLQRGRTRQGRRELSAETDVPEDVIFMLVCRADLARIPFASGSAMRTYTHAGYPTLQALTESDVQTLMEDVRRYMASIGKDSRYGIEPDGSRANAVVMPKIIEVD